MHTVCLQNDTDVADYNFNSHQPILVIFGRNVAEGVHYRAVACYPTTLGAKVSELTWES